METNESTISEVPENYEFDGVTYSYVDKKSSNDLVFLIKPYYKSQNYLSCRTFLMC